MTRGRTIALVILALVVATVLALEPVRVWDALTLRTVEERLPNGNRCRYRCRRWVEPSLEQADALEVLDESGRKIVELTLDGIYREWAEDGDLKTAIRARGGERHGIESIVVNTVSGGKLGSQREQNRYVNGVLVERRSEEPWFSPDDIAGSVMGAD